MKNDYKRLENSLSSDDKEIITELKYSIGFIRSDLLIEQFYLLTDKVCDLIQKLHPSIPCLSGCNLCCRESVPDIHYSEWLLIKQSIDKLSIATKNRIGKNLSEKKGCPLLIEGKCSVYSFRPLQCRAKGYFFIQKDNPRQLEAFSCSSEKERIRQEMKKDPRFIYLPLLNKFQEKLYFSDQVTTSLNIHLRNYFQY